MKKKLLIITTICILTLSFFIVRHYLNTYSISNLPTGELITESTSPNGEYTIKTYLCGGNATVDFSIRGELLIKSKNPQNIYWEYKTNKSIIKWLNNNTVVINGHEINLPNGKYDWRNSSK